MLIEAPVRRSPVVTAALAGLLLAALALLFIAWAHPLITVQVFAKLPPIMPSSMRNITILDETRSVITMVGRLNETGYTLIAGLIVAFAIVLPILKNLGMALLLFARPGGRAGYAARFLQFIGRFAMVDIFAAGIIVSVVGAASIGGPGHAATPVEVQTITELRSGFYYFVGYIFLSFALDIALALRFRRAAPAMS